MSANKKESIADSKIRRLIMKDELGTIQNLFNVVMEFSVNYGFQVIGAIIILCVGILVARRLSVLIIKICQKQNLDETLSTFFGNVTKILVLSFFAFCLSPSK